MSNLTTPTSAEQKEQNGFGAKLAAARKKKSLSVDQVAHELNILKRHVEAIESEAFDELPQFAFARGFVVNYTKFLELPTDEIVKAFETVYPKSLRGDTVDTIKPPVQPMGTLTRGRTPVRLNFGLIVGVIALILLALGILKLVGGSKAVVGEQTDNAAQVADGLTAADQAQGAALGSSGTQTTITASTITPTTNAGSALPQTTSPTTGTPATLDLWIKERITITVKDATGAVLLTGEQGRGGHALTGMAPFSIDVNNPQRLNIDFNKNPVNMKQYGNKQANITLQ